MASPTGRSLGLLPRIRLLSIGVGLAVTALAVGTPFVRLAYRVPGLSPVIDTTVGLVALLLATVLFGRARESRRAADSLLTVALAIAGLGNLLLSALPNAILEDADPRFVSWAPAMTRAIVAMGFCTASLLSPTRIVGRVRANTVVVVAGAVVAVVALAVIIGLDALPDPVDPDLDPNSSRRPLLAAHPLALAIQSVDLTLYATAAAGFWRTSVSRDDELLGWLSAASILAAFARLNYLLFPSLYTEWFYTGDLLRLESFGLLLVGAAREIQGYWAGQTRAAVAEERRRLARDIHDGVAQELAFIASRAGSLRHANQDRENLEQLHSAALRALDESRLAIRTLTAPGGTEIAFEAMLVATTEEIARRHGAELTALVTPDVSPTGDAGLQLVRIAGEAVVNACRHGGAHAVHLSLERSGRGYRMLIRDDGAGFDPDAVEGHGFGLVGMRERAEAMGGTLAVRSGKDRGTEVEVRWP